MWGGAAAGKGWNGFCREGSPRARGRGAGARPRVWGDEWAAARRCSGGGGARSEGKKVGEHEWVTRMLTVLLDWTEEGREREFNGGGGAQC